MAQKQLIYRRFGQELTRRRALLLIAVLVMGASGLGWYVWTRLRDVPQSELYGLAVQQQVNLGRSDLAARLGLLRSLVEQRRLEAAAQLYGGLQRSVDALAEEGEAETVLTSEFMASFDALGLALGEDSAPSTIGDLLEQLGAAP